MTDYGNPDVDTMPDDAVFSDEATPSVLRRRDALVNALQTAKGTVDAKAAHVLDQLEHDGWLMFHLDDGTPVQLRSDEQVVTVPAGYEATVTRIAIDGPGDQLIDPELSELAEIVARLEALDPEARERVAGFVTHRYGPPAPPAPSTWGQPWYRPVQQAPGEILATGGVIGRPQATRISE